MATLTQPSVGLTGEPPASAQPGGFGPFVRLELLWDRLRRRLLRTFRPGYVRRLQQLRQGSDAVHDVIDARDLKFIRNVSGYSFRPEDDAFAGREHCGFARYGIAELLGFSAIFLTCAVAVAALAVWVSPWFWLALVPVILLEAEILWFFRDPQRTPPADLAALISPADGTITHVEAIHDPTFPGGRARRISIFLSVFNVHGNRIPRAARVVDVRYFPGEYLDARHADCAQRNEQLWLDLEEPDGRRIRIKQVSGAIARRIVCWVKPGEVLHVGQRYGMIKFGSRTDVLIPDEPGVELLAKVGDKVKGGLTILLRRPGA